MCLILQTKVFCYPWPSRFRSRTVSITSFILTFICARPFEIFASKSRPFFNLGSMPISSGHYILDFAFPAS